MLQGLMVGRWVPYDHILLINLFKNASFTCYPLWNVEEDVGSLDHKSCCLYSCHKILLCLHGRLVHQGFHAPPEMEIQWCRVRWARGPGYWASMSSPSVAKGVIQVETQQGLVVQIQVEPRVISDMPVIFPRVRHDIIRRYTKCIEVRGSHIEHLL